MSRRQTGRSRRFPVQRVASGAAPATLPTASLIGHWELRDAATSGGNVTSLADRSAAGNNLSGVDGTGADITLSADADYGGELVGLYTTATSKHLFRSTFVGGSIAQPNTVLWLGEWSVTNAQHAGIDAATAPARAMLRMEAAGSVSFFAGTSTITVGTPTVDTPTPILIVVNGAASTHRFGSGNWAAPTTFSATPGTAGMNGCRLGANVSGGSTQPMRGRIAMAAVWNKALDANEVAQVAAYVNQEFGQTITV